VWSDYHIQQYQATQIGTAPWFIQGDPELPSRILCTISSVHPSQHEPYPFVNRPAPLMPEGKWDYDRKYLMIDDVGCIYNSIDDRGELHWTYDSY
jgi:hypothetical protein